MPTQEEIAEAATVAANEAGQASGESTAEAEARRGRGRPSLAELTAKDDELSRREAALLAAEENLRQIAAQLEARGIPIAPEPPAAPEPPVLATPGRSGSARTGAARSDVLTAPIRQRRYKSGEMPNEFHIPREQIPDGISYQWNTHEVFGQGNNAYNAFMQMQGWEPVHSSRHPHLCPPGYDGPIIIKGQILMERPVELTQEALQEQYDKARGEVAAKEEQLHGTPAGTFERQRANGTNEFIQVKRDIEIGTPHKPNYQYEPAGPVIE